MSTIWVSSRWQITQCRHFFWNARFLYAWGIALYGSTALFSLCISGSKRCVFVKYFKGRFHAVMTAAQIYNEPNDSCLLGSEESLSIDFGTKILFLPIQQTTAIFRRVSLIRTTRCRYIRGSVVPYMLCNHHETISVQNGGKTVPTKVPDFPRKQIHNPKRQDYKVGFDVCTATDERQRTPWSLTFPELEIYLRQDNTDNNFHCRVLPK